MGPDVGASSHGAPGEDNVGGAGAEAGDLGVFEEANTVDRIHATRLPPTQPTRVNYVGFPTSTTITHAHHVRSKYALHVKPVEVPVPPLPPPVLPHSRSSAFTSSGENARRRPDTLRLLPLLQFYDSMHVASTRWYLSRVFGRERQGKRTVHTCTLTSPNHFSLVVHLLFYHHRLNAMQGKHACVRIKNTILLFWLMSLQSTMLYPVDDPGRRYINLPRGGFIEDTLGQHMLATIRGPKGVLAHADFGLFLYQDDTGETKCGHIDGHDVLTESATCRKYGFTGAHTSAEEWEKLEGGRGAAYWEDEKRKNANNNDIDTKQNEDEDDAKGSGVVAAASYEMVMGYLDPAGTSRLSQEIQI